MYKGSLVTIEDLSNGQIEDILDLAQEIEADRDAFYGLAARRIMASVFLEPSTRTRGSFEAAMKRLGGDTITTADPKSSSTAKGESLADTIRIWSSYSDLIVLRHPWEGAARLAAEYSDVPVINAGDGSHEHPTQTLLDLYTLRKEFGSLQGLSIVLCGDLKNGRTIHSLTYALSRFGTEIIFMSGEGLELPDHVMHKVETTYGRRIDKIDDPGSLKALYGDESSGEEEGAPVHAVYITASQPHMRTLFEEETELRIRSKGSQPIAIYQTRMQQERQLSRGQEDQSPRDYPRVTPRRLAGKRFKRAIVLHPLPRIDELSHEMDADPRSKYFEQARNGVPVRMALIALMLGLKPWKHGDQRAATNRAAGQTLVTPPGIQCMNPDCVAQREAQSTQAQFTFYCEPQVRLVCSYCERETFPSFYRYPWGEVYYPVEEYPSGRLDPSMCAFFLNGESAEASGLRSPKRLAGKTEGGRVRASYTRRSPGGTTDG